ncbi:hypothetical protein AZE42_12865 [Rhizopogon vesiculosus]|uniref:Uncharacterized protein n=1 Tax=Rhizopogon vesiculosus TaxID=180088 RepID=A0A1J8PKL2_9AGAM|nr:hypothetical protein AZE42_12865 [Rhizopogon vesiculosus]
MAAIKDTGILTGMNVLYGGIINEPNTVTIAYSLDKKVNDECSILRVILNLGGGTFDVSLLTIEEGIFGITRVQAHEQDEDMFISALRECPSTYNHVYASRH